MTREPLNEAFAQTSFLDGASASYVEELHRRFQRNPAEVDADWRRFFQALRDDPNTNGAVKHDNGGRHVSGGPSWQRPSLPSNGNAEILAALSGDWQAAESQVQGEFREQAQRAGFELSPQMTMRATQDSIRALQLIRSYRVRGHLAADLDPLGITEREEHPELLPITYGFSEADLDRPVFIDNILPGIEMATIRQVLEIVRTAYCRHVGVEYMHISDPEQRKWIQTKIEGKKINFTPKGKRAILIKLIQAESFEQFCQVKYTGTKRFGLEGGDAMIPALEQIIKRGGALGVQDIVIGMPHRGRLNVLANVMAKPYQAIFNEFKGGSSKPNDVQGSGDVKYHLGASSDRIFDGNTVHLSLTANPSHLEIVDPVVLGKVRAKQDAREDRRRVTSLPLLLHGDAAFAGQGVVAECFGLSGLKGHRSGGSIHFIVNNQIGFTTAPHNARSSPYPSDVARMVQAPIFHVNGDDAEAVVHVAKIATEFRQKFHKPVVIDMFCYRRHGHNEGDEPSFTQPKMYKVIKDHETVVGIYAKQLAAEGIVLPAEFEEMRTTFRNQLENEFNAADSYRPNKADWFDGKWSTFGIADDGDRRGETGVELSTLKDLGEFLTTLPKDFNLHKTLDRVVKRRAEMTEIGEGVDWAMAEQLALGSLLKENFSVRFSGQDVERGTFSQRHAVYIDQENERRYTPLKHLGPNQARFEIINSMLSEEAVLGFEYGYSLAEPMALVLWEAQFGDFANGAQVVIDQFIASGESKWLRQCGLVLLLPHGYEGQGPEHSSARLERFLQLSAEDNWQIANCTTPSNYFHILRRQMHRKFRKPLVIMTPKSLLRNPKAVSKLTEMGPGSSFHRLLRDSQDPGDGTNPWLKPDAEIRRVVLCSGKVYYDLLAERDAGKLTDVYLLRVEQLFPAPLKSLLTDLSRFPNADVVWCQEEPRNMGAYFHMEPILESVLGRLQTKAKRATYAGRAAAASPATGQASKHAAEQKALIAEALML